MAPEALLAAMAVAALSSLEPVQIAMFSLPVESILAPCDGGSPWVSHSWPNANAPRLFRELVKALAEWGVPGFLRFDNGPDCICQALRIWLKVKGCKSMFIRPGSPWVNGHAESLNSLLRAEMLDAEVFANLAEAQMKILLRRPFYNQERPSSSLGYFTLDEAAERFRDSGRASLSLLLENAQLTTRRDKP